MKIDIGHNRFAGKNEILRAYSKTTGGISGGLDNMTARLHAAGGCHQQDRMIQDKRRGLDRSITYSYQGAFVKKVFAEDEMIQFKKPIKALINSNKLKQDYDDKIISIHSEFGFKPGDVFEWIGTNTYWLIYLQDLTELAYFRGDIRKCRYQINWLDENGEECMTYAAIRGPVETKINFIQKAGISLDVPNHSLNILMPKNEQTVKKFRRYSKFYLNNIEDYDEKICWRVEATDSISMPGVLEITAVEYYANETEDNIEAGLVGDFIMKPVDPTPAAEIIGETFIKPKQVYKYTCEIIGDWFVDSKLPIQININKEDNSITLEWKNTYSGQFDLYCGDFKKTIVVESLF